MEGPVHLAHQHWCVSRSLLVDLHSACPHYSSLKLEAYPHVSCNWNTAVGPRQTSVAPPHPRSNQRNLHHVCCKVIEPILSSLAGNSSCVGTVTRKGGAYWVYSTKDVTLIGQILYWAILGITWNHVNSKLHVSRFTWPIQHVSRPAAAMVSCICELETTLTSASRPESSSQSLITSLVDQTLGPVKVRVWPTVRSWPLENPSCYMPSMQQKQTYTYYIIIINTVKYLPLFWFI